jgi:hypothetical protein
MAPASLPASNQVAARLAAAHQETPPNFGTQRLGTRL